MCPLSSTFDLLNLLVRPPGDLLYFLGIVAVSLVAFFMVLGQRMTRPEDRAARRYTLALTGVVLSLLLLLAGALVVLTSAQDAHSVLPPLERAATVMTLLLVAWAFLTADHARWGRWSNVLLALLVLGIAGGYVVTGAAWLEIAENAEFNLSLLGVVWTFVPAVLCLGTILLLLLNYRLVIDTPLKLVFFVVVLIGFGGTLLQMAQGNVIGDYAGAARLALLAVLPVLPAVLYRMVLRRMEAEILAARQTTGAMPPVTITPSSVSAAAIPRAAAPAPAPSSPVEREAVLLLKGLGMILESAEPAAIPERIVKGTVDLLKADIGALFTLQDANYADVLYAYDHLMKRMVAGMSLNLDHQPTLVNAIERTTQRVLYPDRNAEELEDLYTRLDANKIGPTYLQPLVHNREVVAVLVLGFPYSERELYSSEQELLKGISVISSALLALSRQAKTAQMMAQERTIEALVKGVSPDEVEDDAVLAARRDMQLSLNVAREQISALTRQVVGLQQELDRERSRMATQVEDTEEGQSISQRILTLTDEHQRLRAERERLLERLREAEAALVGATSPSGDALLGKMVDALQREKDDLLTERNRLKSELDNLRAQDRLTVEGSVQNVIESLGQEKARLEQERDLYSERLTDLERQLQAVGIDAGPAGIARLVSDLYEQRASLHAKNEALKLERDTLLSERQRLEATIQLASEREALISSLRRDLQNVAADRESSALQLERFRTDRDEMFAKLEMIKQHRAALLAQVDSFKADMTEAQEQLAQVQTQLSALAQERSALATERDTLHAENQALRIEVEQLIARSDGDRGRISRLGEEGVSSLTRMIETLSEQRGQLERELNDARTQVREVQSQLDALRAHLQDQQVLPMQATPPDALVSLVQELHTPMTSITKYIELLLDESHGILGEMQRKFLLRVQANTVRLEGMLSELVRLTTLDSGQFVLSSAPVDIVNLIDDTLTAVSPQIREKGLELVLDLSDSLPPVNADHDALGEVIGQLLTNAYLASPPRSKLSVVAQRRWLSLSPLGDTPPVDTIFVSIEDRGGGITLEDQARVFARKYKAENPLIPGLGDTGVGMSIARALVEAHGGRLWLETREGVGSIFCFALPLALNEHPIAED